MNKLICLLAVLLSICCRTAVAQTETATISGRITDPQGAVIAEADVLATNIDTNVTVSTKANSSGIYVIPNLPPGNYRLTVKNLGFKEIVKTGLVLHVQDTIAQNFAMEIGSAQETITVTGGAPLINTESAAVSTIVDRQFVENMPLNGRTLQSLLTLSPGVVLVNAATSSDGGQISINGQRPTASYFNLDGVSANIGVNYQNAGGTIPGTSALGSTNSLVSVEALQEFRIQTSSYAPEYGRSPGGQVTLATRSGTNEYHGAVFEYLRNDVFDARDWFVNQSGTKKPPLRLNNFGGVLGGPIFRNKTFFFLSYEGQRLVQPKFAITSVPSLASRQASLPASQPILNAYPVPNGPDLGGGLAQVSSGYSNRGTLDAGSVRLDHNFNDKIRTFTVTARRKRRTVHNRARSHFRQPSKSTSMCRRLQQG